MRRESRAPAAAGGHLRSSTRQGRALRRSRRPQPCGLVEFQNGCSEVLNGSCGVQENFRQIFIVYERKRKSLSRSDSLRPHGRYSPWQSPSQSKGVCGRCRLQALFPPQRSHLGLPPCGRVLYQLSHQGSLTESKLN